MALPSFQHACYSVVPLMASILSISRGSLIGRAQSDAAVTVAQTQHYHHTVTFALHGHTLLLIQICTNLGAGDSLFFIALFLSFFGFLSSTNLCFTSLYFVISVQRKKLLCDCSSLPVEMRNLPALPELREP